jgi:monofunctional biosynthetic peptidoglycan transglycosylase
VIEWGDGIFGAEAAARAYFSSSSASLGPEPSALLAGAIVNPRLLNPGHPTPRLRRRQNMILGRMGHVVPPPDAAPPTVPSPEGTAPDALPPTPPPAEPPPPASPPPAESGSGSASAGRAG